MDEKRNYKIAIVFYTHGIEYDDRVRKEILTIQSLYPNISFKIFAVEPENREEEGVSSYGIPYRIPFLKSRVKYSSGTHTLSKAYDFYKTVKNDLNSYDAIWCADVETFLFVLLTNKKPIVWDLHELPSLFIQRSITRFLFRLLENRCKVMIHANGARLNYLKEKGMINHFERQFVLRNYSQFDEVDNNYDSVYYNFVEWLGSNKCVYLQGLNSMNRAPFESVSAILSFPDLKAVVVGKFDEESKKQLINIYGIKRIEESIYFTGMINQMKTPQFIQKCFMSLIFYKNTSPNNYYCEANRLYQNIINGNPVVIGDNPPMKELVNKYNLGVCIDNDGTDIEKIKNGISLLIKDYDMFKTNTQKYKDIFYWNSQDDILKLIVEKWL